MTEKVVIWKGAHPIDLVTVRSCLELNGIPVITQNESGVRYHGFSSPQLLVYKNDHGPAVKILFENGYISSEDFREVMGLNRDLDAEKARNERNVKIVLAALVLVVFVLLVAALFLFT